MCTVATLLAAVGIAVGAGTAPAARPFVLPPSAVVVIDSADGRGWAVKGEMKLAFRSAQARLATAIAAAGWAHLHSIELGRDRVLESWSRGGEELTVMTWRISAGRSGFSYGLSARGRPASAKRQGNRISEVKNGKSL